ncbi:MAG: AAA family ATPase [Bacillota bacterium]|nr:AAA family ATPase [Bacillota bacterium]
MKLSRLSIKNFLGIDEVDLDLKKINYVQGPKGSGKTSTLEAIEKVFTNKNRRTEIIKHGEDEACLYIKTDDGLEIDRKIRNDKSDYLKVRKNEAAAPSTEKFLRSMIHGQIFRPLDWIKLTVDEQTKSILSMLEIGWTMEQINGWFGEIPSNIDYEMHILQILKAIETKYFKEREAINRESKELEIQVKGMMDELPAGYDGETWRNKKLQEYYNKVSEAQKVNHWINEANTLKNNYEDKIKSLNTAAEGEKSKVNLKFNDQRQDIKDIIELSKAKIEKAKDFINNSDHELDVKMKELINENTSQNNVIDEEYKKAMEELEKTFKKEKERLLEGHNIDKEKSKKLLSQFIETAKKEQTLKIDEQKDLISINETKIATKEQEIISLKELEKAELKAVDEKLKADMEKEEITIGKASKYLEDNVATDITPLQAQAEEVEKMQGYLREFDKMVDIRDGKLQAKKDYAANLTVKIEKARDLPTELLKTAKMPIKGISVDENGLIRINGTLIDGLSDGEKLELSLIIAKEQCGELKLICLDRFESLNGKARQALIEQMINDDYQYIMTSTECDDFKILQFDSAEEIKNYFKGGNN